jgi:hypothetical protein
MNTPLQIIIFGFVTMTAAAAIPTPTTTTTAGQIVGCFSDTFEQQISLL